MLEKLMDLRRVGILAILHVLLAACSTPMASRGVAAVHEKKPGPESGSCPFDADPQWKSKLLIYHFYVGQGDSTFIRTPSGMTMLLDAGLLGAGNSVIIPTLHHCGIAEVDYGLITHPHNDHYGGWLDIFRAAAASKPTITVKKAFFYPGAFLKDQHVATSYWKELNSLGPKVLKAQKTANPDFQVPKLGTTSIEDNSTADVTFDVVAVAGEYPPSKKFPSGFQTGCFGKNEDEACTKEGGQNCEFVREINSVSIAQIIRFRGFAYWAGGDLTSAGYGDKAFKGLIPDMESPVASHLAETKKGPVDVYHCDHHCSNTSSSVDLLQVLKPKYAVASVGIGVANGDNTRIGRPGDKANSYHLPDEGALVRLNEQGVQGIFMTSRGETEVTPPNAQKPRAVRLDDHAWTLQNSGINIVKDGVVKPVMSASKDPNGGADIMLTTDGKTYQFFGENIKDEPHPVSDK